MLDRALIYRAISWTPDYVLIVGAVVAAQRGLEAPSRADGCQVALGNLVRDCIDNLLRESVATTA